MSKKQDINQRLNTLPTKVALPFRRLLAGGQLNEELLSTVLDAGELTGECSRLLGFTVAFQHLRSQGVPIQDVIRMAKTQQRRINFGWSAKRWKQEHDRLSRAEALDRLAKENVAYDVSKYETLLPARFDGYLIRTSRRLGIEGLRQRHCIASYHPQLKGGSCAIASVIVDRQRWTVQLFATRNPETKLRIGQIKTRLNGLPTGAVSKAIHQMLGVDLPRRTSAAAATGAEQHAYMDNLRRLLPVLRQHDVRHVTVSFDGSGDSGSIEDISYTPSTADEVGSVAVEHFSTASHFEDGQWIRTRELTQGSLQDAIEALTYDYLEETGLDWYNNDGGFGELVIDVQRETVALDVNVRYTESTTEFCSQRDIATGEEV